MKEEALKKTRIESDLIGSREIPEMPCMECKPLEVLRTFGLVNFI